ncbi:alpha/beta hydrolase [Bradyrhizobium sp. AUGA SZCCT0177]|uniref:alpha/beta fold hydrolase n=1 Tax=Bradyrhizobium sp. AUGA SZCCT0177 TaxID=2807665 RepID=UPI001BA7EA14|nr:alpha/beta hydrolase [Bradyrhizobium sp. AUGA SZCCT0177]MBR1282019.1 alpha/beta hydrolase [Bradyrhizobium sp. AUGA SZCCT0177]
MKISMPDGCGLHVESEGHGDTAIVFLHGIMMSGAVFKRQVSALSADHRVVTVDLRGFGQSDKPETGYSGENFVADLKGVIDHLNLTRPIIAGWSMGGAIALAFAATFPGIASRLVLIGTTPCLIQRPDWPHAVPPAAAEQLGQALATDYDAGVDGFCRMMFPEANSEDDMNFVRQIMLATPPRVTLACMQNLGGSDLRPLLGSIREPVSVLCGTEDMVCPPAASQFLADTLGGKIALIPGGGHCAFLTRAEEFNSALRAAL